MNGKASEMRDGGGTDKDPKNRSRDRGRHGNFVGRIVSIVTVMEQEDRVLMVGWCG